MSGNAIPNEIRRRGGAVTLHNVCLTIPQFDWLSNQLQRRVHLAETLALAKKQPKLVQMLHSVNDKLIFLTGNPRLEETQLELSRQELRVVGDIVDNQVVALKTKILPSYAKKKSIEGKGAYETRMLEAASLARTLTALSEHIERVYEAGNKRRNSQY